jgi:hypothetical protein
MAKTPDSTAIPRRSDSPRYRLTVSSLITHHGGTSWALVCQDGNSHVLLSRKDFDSGVPGDVVPAVDSVLWLYGPRLSPGLHGRLGSEFYGVDLGDLRLWYGNPTADPRFRRRTPLNRLTEQEERFARDREVLDGLFDRLSPVLQARIADLRGGDSEFRWTREAQLLTGWVNAQEIAAYLRRKHGWKDEQVIDREVAREAAQALRRETSGNPSTLILDLVETADSYSSAFASAIAMLTGRPA